MNDKKTDLVQKIADAVCNEFDRLGSAQDRPILEEVIAEALADAGGAVTDSAVMWGRSDEADFSAGTWTFAMEPGFAVGAGRYAIVRENDIATRPAPAVQVPEGWKLVPAEPTQAMVDAVYSPDAKTVIGLYRAMLAAAPTPATVATEAVAQDDHSEQSLDMVAQGGGVDVYAMLKAVECVMERAYHSATLVCCGRPGAECCGCPEPEWSADDNAIMDALNPVREGLRALLASPAVPVGDGWMPIETAPKDGGAFIATGFNYGKDGGPRHYCMALWEQGEWREASEWNGHSSLAYLTHWQPLPPAPAATKKENNNEL